MAPGSVILDSTFISILSTIVIPANVNSLVSIWSTCWIGLNWSWSKSISIFSSDKFSATRRWSDEIWSVNSGILRLAFSDSMFTSMSSSGIKEAIAISLCITSSANFNALTWSEEKLISSSSSSAIFCASIRLPVDISSVNSGTIRLSFSDSILTSMSSSEI